MIKNDNSIYLRKLSRHDVSEKYLSWMNDSEIVKYTEARTKNFSLEDLMSYVEAFEGSRSSFLFGIFDKSTNAHIGNIKVGPVDNLNKCASVGLLIGDQRFSGRGLATLAVKNICDFAFSELNLHKLTAGVIAGNDASLSVFKKNMFTVEAVRKQHCYFFGEWRDQILLGRINKSWDDRH